jgi:hypothetical protein
MSRPVAKRRIIGPSDAAAVMQALFCGKSQLRFPVEAGITTIALSSALPAKSIIRLARDYRRAAEWRCLKFRTIAVGFAATLRGSASMRFRAGF